MSGKTYLVLLMVLILISMIGGAYIFPEPSWGGAIFYLFMFMGLIGLAGHWLYNIK